MNIRLVVPVGLVLTLAACPAPEEERAEPPAAQPGPAAQQVPNVAFPEGVTHQMATTGQELFAGQGGCFACHGADATGTALGPNLRDQQWLNTDGSFDEIVQVINSGVAQPVQYPGTMPPMGGARLSADQVRQLAAYVYAISRGG